MIFHFLAGVWNPRFDQWERKSFAAEVALHLATYLDRGPDHLNYLMDISDWNINALGTGQAWRPYRKPRIDVQVLLTTREGLAVEWAPRGWWHEHGRTQPEYDFVRFNTNREIGDGHPNNRLFYLKNFGSLMSGRRALTLEEGSLLEATDGYIRRLFDDLRVSFDVRILEAFEVVTEPGPRRTPLSRRVVGATIFNIEERDAERRQAELLAWEKDNLAPFGLGLTEVCDAFKDNERSAAKTARALATNASTAISTAQARKWLEALERKLGRLERASVPPSAKVIEFRPKE